MNNEMIIRKQQMLEALDYIDDDLIAGTLRKIKPETFANTSEPPVMTWRTPFKHWRQFAALAACILLLSIASPLVNYIAEVISNFNAGAGSGTTEATSDLMLETTDNLNEATVETKQDTLETEDAITGEDSTAVSPKLDYLKFIPELEEISEEKMLEIKNAWSEFRYQVAYGDIYSQNVGIGYSTEEAHKIASEVAIRDSKYAYEQFFNGLTFYYYGYLGILDESIVLASYSGTGNVKDVVIGGVDFGFKARFFIYTDGKIINLQEAYDEKIITDDELITIKSRNEQYIESKYDYYVNQFQQSKGKQK